MIGWVEYKYKYKSDSIYIHLYIYIFIYLFIHLSRTERGTYYALDLGGTNLRVLRVHLHGQQSSVLEHEVERQPIPEHLMTSTSKVT